MRQHVTWRSFQKELTRDHFSSAPSLTPLFFFFLIFVFVVFLNFFFIFSNFYSFFFYFSFSYLSQFSFFLFSLLPFSFSYFSSLYFFLDFTPPHKTNTHKDSLQEVALIYSLLYQHHKINPSLHPRFIGIFV